MFTNKSLALYNGYLVLKQITTFLSFYFIQLAQEILYIFTFMVLALIPCKMLLFKSRLLYFVLCSRDKKNGSYNILYCLPSKVLPNNLV